MPFVGILIGDNEQASGQFEVAHVEHELNVIGAIRLEDPEPLELNELLFVRCFDLE